MTETILTGLLGIAMLAVLITLGFGIFNLYRGDEAARSRSNKLMRLRVVLQFIAILLLVAVYYFKDQLGGG